MLTFTNRLFIALGIISFFSQSLVSGILPAPTKEDIARAIRSAIRKAHSLGITGIHDAGVPDRQLQVMTELVEKGEFDFRLYAMLESTDDETLEKYCSLEVSLLHNLAAQVVETQL